MRTKKSHLPAPARFLGFFQPNSMAAPTEEYTNESIMPASLNEFEALMDSSSAVGRDALGAELLKRSVALQRELEEYVFDDVCIWAECPTLEDPPGACTCAAQTAAPPLQRSQASVDARRLPRLPRRVLWELKAPLQDGALQA